MRKTKKTLERCISLLASEINKYSIKVVDKKEEAAISRMFRAYSVYQEIYKTRYGKPYTIIEQKDL